MTKTVLNFEFGILNLFACPLRVAKQGGRGIWCLEFGIFISYIILFNQFYIIYYHIFHWPVIYVGLSIVNFIHYVHTFNHITKICMFAV